MSDNKEDDPQYMMNKAKKEVIMNTLAKNGNECSCACMHTKRATMLTLALGSVRCSTCHTMRYHPTKRTRPRVRRPSRPQMRHSSRLPRRPTATC